MKTTVSICLHPGLEHDGLYRVSGNLAEIQRLRYAVDKGEHFLSLPSTPFQTPIAVAKCYMYNGMKCLPGVQKLAYTVLEISETVCNLSSPFSR